MILLALCLAAGLWTYFALRKDLALGNVSKVRIAWVFMMLFWTMSFLLSMWNYEDRQHLHMANEVTKFALFGVLVFFILLWVLFEKVKRLRKAFSSYKVVFLALGFIAVPLISVGEFLHRLNTEFDHSQPEMVTAIVTSKFRYHDIPRHSVTFELPALDNRRVNFYVSGDLYNRAEPSRVFQLKVRSGWLGWKWTDTAEIGSPNW